MYKTQLCYDLLTAIIILRSPRQTAVTAASRLQPRPQLFFTSMQYSFLFIYNLNPDRGKLLRFYAACLKP